MNNVGSLNIIPLVGNLGNAPEIRSLPNGNTVASFSLYMNQRHKGKDYTTRITVKAWEGLARSCVPLSKGDKVAVVGSLRNNDWTDDKGVKHYGIYVLASEVVFLKTKPPEKDEPPED